MNQPAAELSIMFVGDKKMSVLNAAYRGIDRSTDVLAFPQMSGKWEVRNKKLLGDIVINVPRAESQAQMYGWGFYEEISRLLIHGTLHLMGYDHEKTVYMAGKMRKKEREILNAVKKMDPKH